MSKETKVTCQGAGVAHWQNTYLAFFHVLESIFSTERAEEEERGERKKNEQELGERSKGGKEEKERKSRRRGGTYSQSPKEYLQEIRGKIQEIFHTHSQLIAGYKQPNNNSQISTLVNVTLSEFLFSFKIRNKARITHTDIQYCTLEVLAVQL